MTPYTLHQGDCRDVMAGMEADSVDAIVCDPPYGLRFMGKGWDHGVPGVEFWQAAKRVAKPGAHLLAFGGTRTFHRLTCAIEDAGWEIRDCLSWLYGSGFPKSLDVSKAMDKAAGAKREVVGQRHVTNAAQGKGLGHGDIVGGKVRAGFIDVTAPATDLARQWQGWGTALKPAWEPVIVARKPLAGTVASNVLRYGTGALNIDGCRVQVTGQRPIMEAWESDANLCDMCAEVAALNGKPGRLASRESTAIKPAEQTSSVRAQQSLLATDKRDTGCSDGMSAESTATNSNTGRSGKTPTGRYQMATSSTTSMRTRATTGSKICASCSAPLTTAITNSGVTGRWPSNLIHDGSEDVVSLFPEARSAGDYPSAARSGHVTTYEWDHHQGALYSDSGSAARFFYTSKASREDRNDGTERVITWEHVDLSLEMEQARQHLKAISEATIAPLVASECGTMWFGRKQTGLSPTDIKCITETVIRLITDWRTYNSSPLWNISASIQGAIRTMPDGGSSLAEGAACISSLKRTTTSGETGSLPVAVAALWLLLSQINSKGKRGNTHSTVKPTSLMRYLCRLVTPRDGVVLDPFMGSGSTGKAAILEGFRFVGIDLEPEYVEIARARCEWAMAQPRQLALEETA